MMECFGDGARHQDSACGSLDLWCRFEKVLGFFTFLEVVYVHLDRWSSRWGAPSVWVSHKLKLKGWFRFRNNRPIRCEFMVAHGNQSTRTFNFSPFPTPNTCKPYWNTPVLTLSRILKKKNLGLTHLRSCGIFVALSFWELSSFH